MSANVEYQLICKIVELQDFHTIEKLRIDDSYFLSDEHTFNPAKEAFKIIKAHFHNEQTYGTIPSWQILTTRVPNLAWVPSYDALATLCQELRRNKIRAQIRTFTDELIGTVETDPLVALNTIKEAASMFSSQHEISSDILLSSVSEQLYQEYNTIQNGQGLIGIPWPWEILNDDTQGIQKGQFVIIYGRPKSMKTWIALYVAAHAYMKGARVLVYSLEMTPLQILRRVAAIIARVEYEKFKNARLDPATLQRVFEILYAIRDEEKANTDSMGHQAAFLATQPNGDSSGVSYLHAKIREFNPDIVIVDGIYLMKDDRQKARSIDWKSVAHISQDLKATARVFNIPVIGVTQANRSASKDPKQADLAELAYADALSQDCDLCLRVHKQTDKTTNENEIVLSIPGSREGVLDGFVIHGIPAINFSFKRQSMGDPNEQPAPNGHSNGHSKQAMSSRPPPILPPTNWRAK